MIAKFGLVLLAVSIALCGGCTNNNIDASGELAPQAKPPIADVPMPMGFTFEEARSRHNVSPGGIKFIDHVYTGPAEKFAVARFFRKQMPLSGWQARPEVLAQGIMTLEFEKEADTCRVVLTDAGMFKDHTEIQIQLYPHGRTDSGPRK